VLRIPNDPESALEAAREMASFVPEGSHGAHARQRLRQAELAALPSDPKNLPAFSLSPARKQSSPDLMSPTSRDSVTERNTSRVSDLELSFYAYRTSIELSQTALI
jgi:hypothetical protein